MTALDSAEADARTPALRTVSITVGGPARSRLVPPLSGVGHPPSKIGNPRRMSDLSRIRVSDADRNHVIDRLQQATSEGRLSLDELDDRITDALAARTWSDLDPLVDDLPAAPEAAGGEAMPATEPSVSPAATRAAAAAVLGMGALSIPLSVGQRARGRRGGSRRRHPALIRPPGFAHPGRHPERRGARPAAHDVLRRVVPDPGALRSHISPGSG